MDWPTITAERPEREVLAAIGQPHATQGEAPGVAPRDGPPSVVRLEATAKHRLEGSARDDLLAGMSIREVWKKYGVL